MDAASEDRWKKHFEILTNAIALKTEGNAAYSSKDYQMAIRKYHRALILLKAVGQTKPVEAELFGTKDEREPPKDMLDQKHQLTSECYNNLAACLLTRKEPNYQRIVEHCEKVLEYDAANVKAAFRMGTAFYHLGNLEKARAIITSNPSFQTEKAMQGLLRSIMEKEKVADQKLKATYQKMFMSDSSAHSHSDPILIKDAASAGSGNGQGSGAAPSSNTCSQGTKIIQVASADNEAAC